VKKIDKIKTELDNLREEKIILINKEKEYLEIIQESCPHPLYLAISFKKLSELDIVTMKCLECEQEVYHLKDMLPTFKDGSPKVIIWGDKRLNKALKYQIAQTEFRKLALKSKTGKISEEQAKQFSLGLSKSCNGKENK
jgi:hypothetical protein